MYNPTQSQYNSLLQQEQNLQRQRQLLEQQMQYQQIPPININNMTAPMPAGNFDFNGKWVSNEQEARQTINNNLPLILFDKDNPVFYMKNTDGSFKTFRFEEVVEQKQDTALESKVNALEDKINLILNAIQGSQINTSEENKKPSQTQKRSVKENG